MSVRKRVINKGGKRVQQYFVDFRFSHPDGTIERLRKDSPVNTQRGAEQYERELRQALLNGTYSRGKEEQQPTNEVPTVAEFVPRFLTYSENNNKPSTVLSKQIALDGHILPVFGKKRLDAITLADIEDFKAAMRKKVSGARPRKDNPTKWAMKKRYGAAPKTLSLKTINNVLAVFRRLLSLAYEQGVLDHMPRVKLFRAEKPPFDFLDFDEAERLLAAADPEWRTMMLVALRTGLRQGELMGLQWTDIDLQRARLHVRRTIWHGKAGLPKGGRARTVDLPDSAVEALKVHRHLKGPYVFCQEDGALLTPGLLKMPLTRALRRSGIARAEGVIGWHDLRHTYGSHLAMRGVPLKVIQELMGHASLEQTMRYAHLTPEVRRDAVKVLDQPAPAQRVGNGWAMEGVRAAKSPATD